jgi:serine/threonine-protein kinase RsbW
VIEGEDGVALRVPASDRHLFLLRTTVAGIAGREDFTLDEIDDLRMAVEEAGAQLLRHAPSDGLELRVAGEAEALVVEVSAALPQGALDMDQESFSFMILEALSDELATRYDDGRYVIRFTKRRAAAIG